MIDEKVKIVFENNQVLNGIPFGENEYISWRIELKKKCKPIETAITTASVTKKRFRKSQYLRKISALINEYHPLRI